MARILRKSLDSPDEIRRFERAMLELTTIGSLTVGRGIVQPGWRWSTHLKPIAGTDSCQVHHVQLILAGRLHAEMDDGESVELVANDLVDMPPGHDAWVVGDETVVALDLSGNIGAMGLPGDHDRVVATLLMSDIVDSTARLARVGDSAWKQLLADHNRVIRVQLDRYRGHEVNTTGDGFLATFLSAVSAVRCAAAMADATRQLGLEVRIGVHTGEIEVMPTDIGDVAVHATARIMALGGPSEVVVSSVTRTLVEGSGLRFEDRGRHQLKGLDEPVGVYLLLT